MIGTYRRRYVDENIGTGMTKQLTFVVAATLAACLLVPAAPSFARSPVEARMSAELRRARAKADARVQRAAAAASSEVRKATAKADRAARQAGVRINLNNAEASERKAVRRKGAMRRDAVRRSFTRQVTGGDRRPGRR